MPRGRENGFPRGQQETIQEGYNPTCRRIQGYKPLSYKAYRGYKAVSFKTTEAVRLLVVKNIPHSLVAHKGPADIMRYIYIFINIYK